MLNTRTREAGELLTIEHRKESLSRAYVQAVAGRCGLNCSYREFDYGIDMTLHHIQVRDNRYVESGFKLDIQAKSTVDFALEGDNIVYDLAAKNYRDLIDPEAGCPRILVLLCLPRNEAEWIEQSEESFICRRCAYWRNLHGEPCSDNDNSVRIRLPRANVFNSDSLNGIMARIRADGEP